LHRLHLLQMTAAANRGGAVRIAGKSNQPLVGVRFVFGLPVAPMTGGTGTGAEVVTGSKAPALDRMTE
jgi:hypothetical protein